jgi:hypothetical protein
VETRHGLRRSRERSGRRDGRSGHGGEESQAACHREVTGITRG